MLSSVSLRLLPAVALALSGVTVIVATDRTTAPQPPVVRTDARPNIVFILTDDQDLLLNSLAVMPAVHDQIAAQGITFLDDFVPLSLCCPSRSSILTGEYPHNHKVYTNAPPDGGFQRFQALGHEDATLGTAMHDAGYRTALMGKYLNEYPAGAEKTHVAPGWDEWDVPINGAAYTGFNYTLNQNGKLVQHGKGATDYMTDVLAQRARRFITTSARGTKPFFLYLATYAPHKPFIPAPRHAALFPGVKVPRTPSFNEADVTDKPGNLHYRPLLADPQLDQIDQQYRMRLQGLQAVDEMVAGVVQALRATGQLGNTYIFFTSDNGYHMGQHRLLPGKYTAYEEDIRVPLLVRGPDIPAGQTVDAFTLNVDIAPTIAALGDATLKEPVDGRSLLPLLSGGPAPADWRRAILLEQFTFREVPQGTGSTLEPSETTAAQGIQEYPSHLGLRTPTYKYVEYANRQREYYDLVRDPYELQNLASRMDRQYLAKLSGIVHALSACSGDSCRQLEAAPMPVPP